MTRCQARHPQQARAAARQQPLNWSASRRDSSRYTLVARSPSSSCLPLLSLPSNVAYSAAEHCPLLAFGNLLAAQHGLCCRIILFSLFDDVDWMMMFALAFAYCIEPSPYAIPVSWIAYWLCDGLSVLFVLLGWFLRWWGSQLMCGKCLC